MTLHQQQTYTAGIEDRGHEVRVIQISWGQESLTSCMTCSGGDFPLASASRSSSTMWLSIAPRARRRGHALPSEESAATRGDQDGATRLDFHLTVPALFFVVVGRGASILFSYVLGKCLKKLIGVVRLLHPLARRS